MKGTFLANSTVLYAVRVLTFQRVKKREKKKYM